MYNPISNIGHLIFFLIYQMSDLRGKMFDFATSLHYSRRASPEKSGQAVHLSIPSPPLHHSITPSLHHSPAEAGFRFAQHYSNTPSFSLLVSPSPQLTIVSP